MNEAWDMLQANASVTIKVINIKAMLLIILTDLMIPIRTQTHLNIPVNADACMYLQNACAFAWMRIESIKQTASDEKKRETKATRQT